MNRYIMLVFTCLMFPLSAGCAWLNRHSADAPAETSPASIENETPEDSSTAATASEAPLPTLEEMATENQAHQIELLVELVTYQLAHAIAYERAPESALTQTSLDTASAAMFENPADPTSAPKASWFELFSVVTRDLSLGETTLHLTTADDAVFAKHLSAKKAWRSAHVFIRVERLSKDGKIKSSGIIISAPEPKEDEGWSTELPPEEEAASAPSESLSPLGQ